MGYPLILGPGEGLCWKCLGRGRIFLAASTHLYTCPTCDGTGRR